jgi:hypothetical protein
MKGGPGTADELLKIYDSEPAAEAEEIEAEADKQVAIQEAAQKKAAAKEVVKSLEGEGGEQETPAEAESEPETQPSEEGGEDQEGEEGEDSDVPAGVLKARLGDEEVDIPESAEVEFEVNGKPFKFAIKDAIKAKLGQEEFNRNIDRRLTFADQKERRATAQVQNILQRAREVVEISKTGDPLPALKALAKMAAGANGDAVAYEKQFLENLEKVNEIYFRMTPEQREKYFAERRAEEAERRAKELEGQVGFEQQAQAVAQKIGELTKAWGITPEQFNGLYGLIEENLVGPDKQFKSIEEVGPEQVIQVHHELTTQIKVQQAMSKVDKALLKEEDLYRQLYAQAYQNPKWTPEDLEYIIKQVVSTPSKSVQNLNRKVEKARSQRLNSSLKEGSAAKKGDEDVEADREWQRKLEREAWAARFR